MRLWFKNRQIDGDPQAVDETTSAIKIQSQGDAHPYDQVAAAPEERRVVVSENANSVSVPATPLVTPSVSLAPSITGGSGVIASAYKSDHRSLYKQLLGGLYDAVLVTDPKGHVIDINNRVTYFFNYTPEETWDLPISTLIPGVNTALISRILSLIHI